MNGTALVSVVFATLLVVGIAVPAVALSTDAGEPSSSSLDGTTVAPAQSAPNSSSVNVTTGPQLSTVIEVSADDVQSDVEDTAFEISFEDADEATRADALADRAAALRDRAEAIDEDYADATAAYEDGDLGKAAYTQRLATLNARASNVLDSHRQFRQRVATVSPSALSAAEVDRSALNQSIEALNTVTGTGATALLAQFTAESTGEIELETDNGLSIEVESEDGERSREFERPRDDNDDRTVAQSAALETARDALSPVEDGNWTLTSSEIDDGSAYEFEFELLDAATLTGDAEIAVDGSTGDVFSLEEEIEPRDDEADDDEDADDEDDDADDEDENDEDENDAEDDEDDADEEDDDADDDGDADDEDDD
ncbi:hypothetical protein Halru_0283 [Halovivax ruber XH-70]|uniref:PepSY domain-containing protein n=1 Tax=Halovivax ruber (strain DSM 18193 / JCM 13892 / XH-70) TaxID=797302 RepID=L0I8A7_HALRX|nr:hypothetical protein [Halovivax ruber]AGB14929.1 hypothetical protein Halru_0283 [Halovivax ruber XH-70]